jgi:hypothetical protein
MLAPSAERRGWLCRRARSGLTKEDPMEDGSSCPALGRTGMSAGSVFQILRIMPAGEAKTMSF